MASIELIPKLPVMAVQAGVFLANCLVVKKLFVDPYLKSRAERERQTLGSQSEATGLAAEAERIAEGISHRLETSATDNHQSREKLRTSALERRRVIVSAAETESRAYVESAAREIRADAQTERAKVPGIVSALVDQVYRAAVS